MAQTGYTPIQLYYSSTTTNAPTAGNLANGELAINITDGKLFYKDNANDVQVIGWKTTPATAGGTGQTSYAVGDLLYANTTTTLAKLPDVATGNALISGGVGVAPSWGKIGLTTHVSGTLPTANGGTNLTSFTANGVVYASSTSALATGSALVFDGTNLGIGTTSPTAKLEVNDYINTSYTELVAFTGAKGSFVGIPTNQLAIVDSTAQAAGVGGEIIFEGKYDASNITAFASVGGVKENSTSGNYGGAFVVRTRTNGGNLNENARISSDGNFLVGTASALGSGKVGFLQSASGQVLTMQNSNATPYGIVCAYTGAAPNSTISQFIYCDDTVGLKMEVRSNGGIANYAANNVVLSDRREKTNFAPAGSYLDKICAIPVQTFNYIDQNLEEDAGLTLGVVAQDVQAVAPELVTEGNWGSKEEPKMRFEIYQTDLQYALMKCIQEQQALIESLTTRLTALESK